MMVIFGLLMGVLYTGAVEQPSSSEGSLFSSVNFGAGLIKIGEWFKRA